MHMRSLILSGAAAAAVVLAAAGPASAATANPGSPASSPPTASELTVSPASLTFAPMAEQSGVVSAPQTVTITNTASQPVYINESNVIDYTFEFAIDNAGTTCSNITLAVGASCTVAVEYLPLTPGPISSEAKVLVGHSSITAVTIPLSGDTLPAASS